VDAWVARLWQEPVTVLPHALLRYYSKLGIRDDEMMFLIHLIAFRAEGKAFPSVRELEARMSADATQILSMVQRLVQQGVLAVEEGTDEQGLPMERFDLSPLYRRLAELWAEEQREALRLPQNEPTDLYSLFEKEFGRPLSPLECEAITLWLEEDGYSEELVRAALREAVYCGKRNFRYIDRILLEWHKNGIRTAAEARAYAQRFRERKEKRSPLHTPTQKTEEEEPFTFYNWLEEDPVSTK